MDCNREYNKSALVKNKKIKRYAQNDLHVSVDESRLHNSDIYSSMSMRYLFSRQDQSVAQSSTETWQQQRTTNSWQVGGTFKKERKKFMLLMQY